MGFPLRLLFFTLLSLLASYSLSLNNEGRYLMDLKNGLEDPSNMLANWDDRDRTPCNWTGITCTTTSDELSVTSVDLTNYGLVGPFPASLCRLPNLSFLSLQLNFINGSLTNSSSSGLSSCTSLLHLDLSLNLLVGPLPDSLSSLPLLRHLDLSSNNFTGPIPPSFGMFPRLHNLTLVYNLLTSAIPSFLGNLSTLRQLSLSYNPFDPAGTIPPSLANLSSLQTLWLAGCGLVGPIPPALGSLASLANLDLTFNSLTGRIPNELAAGLASIVQIELYNNSLSGPFPSGFSNLTALRRIDASLNHLDGQLPADLFDIPLLDSLHLYQNRITGEIPPGVSRSKTLVELRLFGNRLTGTLPADLGNNSPLMLIDLSDNQLSGEIPASICDRGLLQELLLIDNSFSGSIPDGLARCRTLTRVRLSNNKFSGDIPPGLWGLPHVWLLGLDGNSFSGPISQTISGAHNLSILTMSDNGFSGSIPPEIGHLPSLYQFSAANNGLTGPIPPSLGSLAKLGQLDLHNNSLTGGLLTNIDSWAKLALLNLADNDLTGTIPPQLGNLPVLNYLDLSGNILDGEIPTQLQNLKLDRLNLSNNQLSGSIPPMYKSEAYRTSFLNNPGLCGELAGLCPGLPKDSRRHGRSTSLLFALIFALAGIIVLVIGVGWFYLRYRKFNKAKLGSNKSKWTLTSFHKLGFSEYEILDCLDEDNVIGSGASGKVYKAVLSSGEAVAVKKLWGSAKNVDKAKDDAFKAEVATLGKIRHKNIVKLWCTCSHKECKLLVYEYMPNGSLGDVLHSGKGGALDWPTRYKIALDAAEGLSYLHHDCVPAIVHRDIKSNNILLDAGFGARVADFGVAKAMEAVENGPKSMSVIAGSCGYIAPEYAYTLRVTEKSDIYSFGVVILELVTGKRPIDPEFGEKDLVKWVCDTLEEKGIIDHVVDTKLDLPLYKEEISKVLSIGLLCTSSLPISRPSMRRIVKMLLELGGEDDANSKPKAKQQQQQQEQEQDGKLSPYYFEDQDVV
ncbi:receptor-like protein kinase HSL1 [Iris pallida]|uniref:non-specific serine/threonine protein kinase n=1 Tax=Iris pallida TaxID=29817 RepID=A0AAX6FB97_IRIPA|nr:receptor-like protein kinase HSL1 [Iris pallida]